MTQTSAAPAITPCAVDYTKRTEYLDELAAFRATRKLLKEIPFSPSLPQKGYNDRILQGTDAVICDQCGDCLTICPTEALKRNKLGVVVIDKMLCVGCYLCVGICEKGAFERLEGWLEPYKCTACGICVKACPHAALAVADVPTPAPRII